jgi:hypothetical protein
MTSLGLPMNSRLSALIIKVYNFCPTTKCTDLIYFRFLLFFISSHLLGHLIGRKGRKLWSVSLLVQKSVLTELQQ